MEIDRPDPPYLQIARQIREQILSGELADGDPVPSARQITRDWNVAIATAAKVLSTLRSEGLTRVDPGKGTVVQVRGSLHHSAQDRSIAMHRTGKIYPPGHYAKIRRCELTPASDSAADALGLDHGSAAIRRQRTTYTAQDVPVSTSVSWFDGSLASRAPLLLTTERIQQGTAKYVEEVTGRSHVDTDVQHAAGLANDEDANELEIEPGSAVLLSRNRYEDAQGEVIEYGESTALPGHWVYYHYAVEDGE
ncbi:MAG TPA: GntR family transcriptional regulator [Pseudonocardiaceae bacterium]|jgi:DNA-binding GntR family transcriptional regulator|nr:GntR family transcriptional regulator [Pseudonocardiaceae bacterium]